MSHDTPHAHHLDHAAHEGHDMGHAAHNGHEGHDMGGLNSMALSATLHCLTGCAIGEIAGLMIGTAIGLSTGWTIALAVSLAFLFGYTLSTFPLVKTGLGVGAALSVVFAADTLSIATMELVDNAVMAVIPGAMEAGLVNWVFWVSMMIALTAAFLAAYPVNRYLLARGKGHALTHAYHGDTGPVSGARRYIPNLSSTTLAGVIIAFVLGGLVVSVAAELGADEPEQTGHALSTPRNGST
jgi:preprotein translocase subunit SecG